MTLNTTKEICQEYTDDSVFDGSLKCRQHKKGYRFSIDAVLAAHFHTPAKGEKILDLGCGCGIIGLVMMYRWSELISSLHSLEIQPSLKSLADYNYSANGFDDTCTSHLGDVKNILNYFRAESFSHVVCNPPFYHVESGRQSLDNESKIARHQIAGSLDEFIRAASTAVQNRGSVVFIYPAEMFTELTGALAEARLTLKSIQFIYSYPDSTKDAKLVLVKCIKNGGRGVKIHQPFYVYSEKNGSYSSEMQRLYMAHSNFSFR